MLLCKVTKRPYVPGGLWRISVTFCRLVCGSGALHDRGWGICSHGGRSAVNPPDHRPLALWAGLDHMPKPTTIAEKDSPGQHGLIVPDGMQGVLKAAGTGRSRVQILSSKSAQGRKRNKQTRSPTGIERQWPRPCPSTGAAHVSQCTVLGLVYNRYGYESPVLIVL
jgi:hypothetical protein